MRRPVSLRLFRLRFWRRLRKSRRQVEDISQQAEQGLERHLFKRFGRLQSVRRFVAGWVFLLVLLISAVTIQNLLLNGYFQTLRPVPGGIYNEGVLGTFRSANPLYATSDVDTTVSRLLFASLFTYDQHNQLVGDLASDYSVDARGVTYTVHLKPNLTWQDGQPLTSADVVFTYQLIQNPDARSPLQAGWQGIQVAAPDDHTVTFTLPGPLASFAYNMVNGIVPKHLLKDVLPANLRTADFNTIHPVGAGPFSWQNIQVSGNDPATAEEQIELLPFVGYAGGKPKLQEFVVHAYASKDKLVDAFGSGQLNAAEGLEALPAKLQNKSDVQQHNLLFTAGTYTFFKTSEGVLADPVVRQAMVRGSNVPAVIGKLGYQTQIVREPVLRNQFNYNPLNAQADFDMPAAQKMLTDAGWIAGKDGIRHKDKTTLAFGLTAIDSAEYRMVTDELQKQWTKLGARVDVHLVSGEDFKTTLTGHDYDALLYGISIGADPDVFVYWHSSQADIRATNRLNLSEYQSKTADASLEAGRTRLDPALRIVKYRPFMEAWQQDAPALGLYQPRLLYLTYGTVAGLDDHEVNTAADRFTNVQNWQIRQARITNP